MGATLGKNEQAIKQDSFTANLILFWLKANYQLTNKRVTGETPNTFLGFIPLGSAEISQPLKTIASVSSSTDFSIKNLIVGIILIGIGFSMIGSSFLIGLILLVLGAISVLNSYTATFVITNNGGESNGYQLSILELEKVKAFTDEVNMSIADT